MTSAASKRKHTLRDMPDESFGRKLLRAREDIAGLSLEKAVEAMSEWIDTSTSTISRLEHLTEVPDQRRTRIIAILLAVTYGVRPESLGLDPRELPPVFQRSFEHALHAAPTPSGGDVPRPRQRREA